MDIKTLIVATTSYAGMGPYVSEIANAFQLGDNVFFFFHDYEDLFFKKNIREDLKSISFFYTSENSIKNKLYSILLNKTEYDGVILDVCTKWGINQVHYINECPCVSIQKKFSELGIKVFATIHDLHPHEAKKEWYKILRHTIIGWWQKYNIEKCKCLFSNSEEQCNELNRVYPNKGIWYYPFPSLVTSEVKEGKEVPEEMRSVNLPYILFFGRIEEYKGVEILYKTFVENRFLKENYYLVIAGRGDVFFERSKKDEKNVIFINRYIKDSEIAFFYQNASCVVYPYISATQSGVLSLSFYFGTPTLTSDVSFFKKVMESVSNGNVFKSGDREELKNKLLLMLGSNNSDLIRKQREYYELKYDNKRIRDVLLKAYNNIDIS